MNNKETAFISVDPQTFKPFIVVYTSKPVEVWEEMWRMKIRRTRVFPPIYKDDATYGAWHLWRVEGYPNDKVAVGLQRCKSD